MLELSNKPLYTMLVYSESDYIFNNVLYIFVCFHVTSLNPSSLKNFFQHSL